MTNLVKPVDTNKEKATLNIAIYIIIKIVIIIIISKMVPEQLGAGWWGR